MAFAPERGYTSAGMTFVRHSRVLPPALWRPAIFFFAVAQLFLAFGPLMEGRFGADARSHVEAADTNSHHAHNAADCTACTARDLLAAANHAAQSGADPYQTVLLARSNRDERLDSLRESSSRPRAPPFRQA